MAAFDVPKGVGARRVSRSIMSSGPGGTNYQNFDPFEAADADQANFTLSNQDEEELEVTVPVAADVGKKDVAVRFTARALRVTVRGATLIDSPLKGRIYPDECSWSFGTTTGKRALILSLGKRDSDMWSKLLARTPPAPGGGPQFAQWPYLDPAFGEGKGAYWESSDAADAAWRAYDAATDGPLCVHAARCLAMRATYTTWRRVVDALAPSLSVDEVTLIRRWCYAPKRHVMDCTEGLHSTLVKAAGGPFEHGDWESPYPLPHHCDDPCVVLEPRLRPTVRAAMLDCVLNLLVQPLVTVAGSDRSVPTGIRSVDLATGGVDDGGVSEAWMAEMTARGEALNDSMLSNQLTWWCLDLALWHHVPSRVNGADGFEAAIEPCRHWSGGKDPVNADTANGWTALFVKVRGALLASLDLAEDNDFPFKLAQENSTLLQALVEAKSDAPPCLDADGIKKVRAFVRSHVEGIILALLPTQAPDEPTGFDSPAARGNLSGFDLRLDDWSSAPDALANAARNPQAEAMSRMKIK